MSIAKKVTMVVSIAAGLLLIGAGASSLVLQQERAEKRAARDGRILGQILVVAAQTAIDDHGHLGNLAYIASQGQPADVIFYDADGRAVAPVPVEEEPVVNPRARRVVERGAIEDEILREDPAPATYVYRAPLFGRQKAVGAIELRLQIDSLRDLRPSWIAALIAGALLIGFALLVGAFSSRAIGRPISRLMEGMDEVIHGDLTATLPLERDDEIGRIAYRFNEMTAQLRAAQDQIRRAGEDRLKLEQSLRQSEKLATVGQLSAEIAHEIGTPLNVIGGRARVLERKADQPLEVRKNAEIIAEQAGRITKIIQQMLDLARARVPVREHVDLTRVVEGALAFLEYQTERQSIALDRRLPPELEPVWGDADNLQQVVLNLLLNAIQAMPDGGVLTVTGEQQRRRKGGLDLAPPQDYMVLSVADNGPGILPEQRTQIFEPFYSTKGSGTGLGLTVVHGIVKEHDGWIEVDDAGPGTVFRVYLPTAADKSDEPRHDVDADEPEREQGSGTGSGSEDGVS